MYDDNGLWLFSNIPEGNPIGTLLNPSDVGVVSTLDEDFNPEQESTICYFTFPTIESIDNMIDGLYDVKAMFMRNRTVTRNNYIKNKNFDKSIKFTILSL